jgi:hypothetical protein
MTNSTAQHEMEGEELITFPALQAAADAMVRRGNIRKGGIQILIREVIERWDKSMPSPGEEFRTDESVLEQHFLASLPQREWRVPYGVDGWEGYQLMREIKRRREHGISLAGLAWPPSHDPYAPANDPHHPYYLG